MKIFKFIIIIAGLILLLFPLSSLPQDGTFHLDYSTYLGGAGNDYDWAIAVDASGSAYICGNTSSSNFPTLSAYQSSANGSSDAFVTT